MRLNALELREYVTPRRQTLLLALIRHARGQVLDDLTQMLLRLARKVEWKSQQRLEQWYADRHAETDSFVAVLELATAIKAGEMFVCGSLSHDRFWDRLPAESADPAAISAYAAARGWQDGADGLVRSVKEALGRQAGFLDRALGNDSMGFMRRAKDGRPIVTPTHAVSSLASTARAIVSRLPCRNLGKR